MNSRGLRGAELTPEHDFQLLTLGGSTTECLLLNQDETCPHLLQAELSTRSGRKVWVGNAGVSGHSTREHSSQTPNLLDGYPDTNLVILLLGVNDLGLRLQQDAAYDEHFMDRTGTEEYLIARAFHNYPLRFRSDMPFYKRLEIYARLRRTKTRIKNLLLAFRPTGGGTIEDEFGKNLKRWRTNRANALRIRNRLPDMTAALNEYGRNLRRIITAALDRGARILLITQPSLWRSDLSDEERRQLWWGGIGDFQREGARAEFYSVAALEEGMALYNRELIDICLEQHVDCLDLAGQVPKDIRAFYDGVHFTEAGARVVAREIAGFVFANYLSNH